MDRDMLSGLGSHCSDGLDGDAIEALLSEAKAFWSTSARPTSALLDGSAAQRRERRAARRAIGAVVRSLPTTFEPVFPAGEVA